MTSTHYLCYSEQGILAMNMGPGKHLKGRTLLGGVIKPEEVRNPVDVCIGDQPALTDGL